MILLKSCTFDTCSCAKIMDEHEQRKAQEKKKKMTEVAKKTKPDINEVLRSSSPVNGDMGFSFGGPAGKTTRPISHIQIYYTCIYIYIQYIK